MTETTSIKIPFCGFYYSMLSHELDYVEEREAEWLEEKQKEDGIAPELRLEASTFREILFDVTNYSAAHEAIARDYAEAFAEKMDEVFEFDTGFKFEEMTSPRFYNFETDRLFCRVPVATVERLFEISKGDDHKTLAKVIRERHTSRDGFISFYENDLAKWLEKPLEDWDHNELETLLLAALEIVHGDAEEVCREVEMWVLEGEGVFHAHHEAVDWERFDEIVREKRAELEDELRADDPEWEPPYRCPETLDLFA